MSSASLQKREEKIAAFEETISSFKQQNGEEQVLSSKELLQLEKKVEKFRKAVFADLSPLERIAIARHFKRPKTMDYLSFLCGKSFMALRGDRLFGDDSAIVGGLGEIDHFPFLFIGHEKGTDTPSRVKHNFGMPHPEGFRKAKRLLALAEKFALPVVSFIDTPGAYPGLEAEERGQGQAIADSIQHMMQVNTPIIVVIIGEASSGGALGIAIGDHVAMLEHAYYSVISPEGCASILWKDAAQSSTATRSLKLHPEDLIQHGVIDQIISEPIGGAHQAPRTLFNHVKHHILQQREKLASLSLDLLLEQRYQRFRKLDASALMQL